MPEAFEDWFVKLAENGDESILKRLRGLLSNHYSEVRHNTNMTAERERLTNAFEQRAPKTTLSDQMLEIIRESN